MKKMTRKIGFSILMLCASLVGKSQTTWYFGNKAGVKFTNAVPTATSANTAMNTGEGSAVMVDDQNNVVMFTDGVTVWNGANQAQPGITLFGDASSTQTALIVPIPGTFGGRAFIFTVNAAENAYGNAAPSAYAPRRGLRVSVVTISGIAPNTTITPLNNDPANINQQLTPGTTNMGEKLDVIPDQRGGYWVVTHGVGVYNYGPGSGNYATTHPINNSDEQRFHCYNVNCNTTDINSLKQAKSAKDNVFGALTGYQSWNHPYDQTTGVEYSGSPQFNGEGQLKMVRIPNTTYAIIATTIPWSGNAGGSQHYRVSPIGQIYRMNLTNGDIDMPTEWNLGFIQADNSTKDGIAYGLEFSENAQYLYVSSCSPGTSYGAMTGRIYRYDISSFNAVTIANSRASIYSNILANTFGQLQRAPGADGTIYIARSGAGYLSAIKNPNTGGSFFEHEINLASGTTCSSGLPTTVLTRNVQYTPTLSANTRYCSGLPVTVTGGYIGDAPTAHNYRIYGSDANGNKVDAAGNISTTSWFDVNYWYWGSPATYEIPNSATYTCGKYYSIELLITDNCNHYGSGLPKKTFFIDCQPSMGLSSPVCFNGSVGACINSLPPGSSVFWSNNVTSATATTVCYSIPIVTGNVTITATISGVCNKVLTGPVTPLTNNPDFSLTGNLPANSPYYTITATPATVPGANVTYDWDITEVDLLTNSNIPSTTVTNDNNCWHASPNYTTFNGYNYTVRYNGTLPTPCNSNAGLFKAGRKYKVTRTTSTAGCPNQSHSKTIQLCTGTCRTADGSNFIVETVTSSIENKEIAENENRELMVFPNPSNGSFTIDFPSTDKKTILVYDVLGKIIFETISTEKKLAINLSEQQKGIYLLKVINGDKSESKKIIIE